MLRPDTIAIIDVGSNAVRLFVARLRNGEVDVLADQREGIRLGADSFQRGSIQSSNQRLLIDCLWSFRLRAHRLGAIHIKAVATSALRDARNGEEIIAKAWARTGIQIEVIDGETEARLLHRAILSALSLKGGPHLLADLGGGSLEVVSCDKDQIRGLWSLRAGTVRLLRRVGVDRTYNDYARVIHAELGRLADHPFFVRDIIGAKKLFGTGGNFRALLRLFHRFHIETPSDRLSIDNLDRISDLLFRLDYQKRVEHLKLKPDRADVIRPAIVLIIELMKNFGFNQVTVPNIGIKNGLFWEFNDRLQRATVNKKLVMSSANSLGFSTLQQWP